MNCLNCSSQELLQILDVKDHFLTQEKFEVHRCPICGLHVTRPRPALEELGKYYESEDYLSHGDDQKGMFAWAYRQAKRYNLSSKARLLNRLHSKGSLLDYGCGTGDFLTYMQASSYTVRGAEPSAQAIEHVSPLIRDLVQSPEEELASQRIYNIITLWHVLEHIPDPKDILSQLITKIQYGGHLIIAVPNPSSSDAKHYADHWAGWDVPRHLWHFEPESIIRLVEGLGLQHVSSHPMWFDAFYVSLLSERYKNGNSAAGLLHAGISNLKALFDKKRRCSSQIYIFKAV